MRRCSSVNGATRSSAFVRPPRVDYKAVRELKGRVLRASFERFLKNDWVLDTGRAVAFRTFIADESWWLDEYSVYRALRADVGERPWPEWPAELRDREPVCAWRTLASASTARSSFYQYVQWIASRQWQTIRQATEGIEILGDFPFMVTLDSADVWSRQARFSPRRVGRHAARCVQRDRPGMGTAAVQLGRSAQERFRVASHARAKAGRTVRRVSRRSPRRLLSHLRPAARRASAVLHAIRRACAGRAGRDRDAYHDRHQRRRQRRGSRHRARSSCASRLRGSVCPGTRCCAGNRQTRCCIRRCLWP